MLEEGVHPAERLVAISAAHVSAPAFIRGANVLEREAVLVEPALEFAELAFHCTNSGSAHFAKDLAGRRQNELRFEKYDTGRDRLDFRLSHIQRDSERGADFFDPFEAML